MNGNKDKTLEVIKSHKIFSVIREYSQDDARNLANHLIGNGAKLIEFTLTTPGSFELIAEFAKKADIVVGAGTVMNEAQAYHAKLLGAQFIISPIFIDTLDDLRKEIVVIQGGMTPNEIYHSYKYSDLVKVYPANLFDITQTYHDLEAIIPRVQLMASGGVDSLKKYTNIGFKAVAAGNVLKQWDDETLQRFYRGEF
jgi:2-dehydro-3-deoxyphosphogluconate aldolase / (4S)-4-hydroxy-2-oxoglutarate aldolase